MILETVRREDPNDSPKWVALRSSFLKELENPVYGDETLTSFLFVMLLSFCNGTMPHYPVKKILLLLWKSILAMMGGMKELVALKQEAREAVSLEPSFPENVHCKPLVLPQPNYDPRYICRYCMDEKQNNFSLKSILCHLFCKIGHITFLLPLTEVSFHRSHHASWGGPCPLSVTRTGSARRRLVGGAWSCAPRRGRRTWRCTLSRAGQSLAVSRLGGLGKTSPVSTR